MANDKTELFRIGDDECYSCTFNGSIHFDNIWRREDGTMDLESCTNEEGYNADIPDEDMIWMEQEILEMIEKGVFTILT